MRIFIVGSFADSLLNFRGALIRELIDRGHEVHACAPSCSASLKNKMEAMGVTLHDVSISRTGMSPFADLRFIVRMAALLRKNRAEAVLSYTIKPVVFAGIAARFARVPRIYSMITGVGYSFTSDSRRGRLVGGLVKLLLRITLRENTCVIFQNPDDRNLFMDSGLIQNHQRVAVVHGSGVDIKTFSKMTMPLGVSFLLIARLIREKGIIEYVQAARIVRRVFPNVLFRIAGWIDEHPNSIRQADLQRWSDEGLVQYLGKLDDVRPALGACSVYVLPSLFREGTPRSVLEAMATGRPIITTDVPGCRETVLNGKNGYLVPPGDVNALVQSMISFIEKPDRLSEMGEFSRRIAEEKYDVRKVNREILRALEL